jgi:hypothetical protein
MFKPVSAHRVHLDGQIGSVAGMPALFEPFHRLIIGCFES